MAKAKATDLDDLMEQLRDYMDNETGHDDYEPKKGHSVCVCGKDFGPADNYNAVAANREDHFYEVIKGYIQNFLDNQKDWDAVASELFKV